MATTPRKRQSTASGKRLRCFLGFHRMREFRSADGDPYRKCLDCGRFVDITPKMGP